MFRVLGGLFCSVFVWFLSLFGFVVGVWCVVEQKELDQGEYLVRRAVSLLLVNGCTEENSFWGIHIE